MSISKQIHHLHLVSEYIQESVNYYSVINHLVNIREIYSRGWITQFVIQHIKY